ncbi:MAG: hypothetical protein KC777_06725, partial [Cyanobacteria bacterium HKST-UBA02]|nr:hypothetical protein [Cyanobacteria bacterium HKST-UBA02]
MTVSNHNCYRSEISARNTFSRSDASLEAVLAVEDLVIDKHLAYIDNKADWVHRLIDCYSGYIESLWAFVQDSRHLGDALLLQSTLIGRRELTTGFTTLLRGHHLDMYSKLRRALEFTIFTAWSLANSEAAVSWVEAGTSEENWQKYRRQFRIHYL